MDLSLLGVTTLKDNLVWETQKTQYRITRGDSDLMITWLVSWGFLGHCSFVRAGKPYRSDCKGMNQAHTLFEVISFQDLQNHPFKMTHLIYWLACHTGQFWQMEGTLSHAEYFGKTFPCARLKVGAYFCYCAYVLRISRYSGFLWVVPAAY